MGYKKLIPFINTESESSSHMVARAEKYVEHGADALFVFRYSSNDIEREEFLSMLKELVEIIEVPIIAGIYFEHPDDAKKAFNTGVSSIAVQNKKLRDYDSFDKAVQMFGADKVYLEMDEAEFIESEYKTYSYIVKHLSLCDKFINKAASEDCQIMLRDSLRKNDMVGLLSIEHVIALSTNAWVNNDLTFIKNELSKSGLNMNVIMNKLSFKDFKTNSCGLIPVIAQDYKTNEVLMLAYMNEEAFRHTIETGKMTYYSRSRNQLWCKGETSGHFQYVKKLYIDCDNDTILAKVNQIGAACHTGNRTCFFTDLT